MTATRSTAADIARGALFAHTVMRPVRTLRGVAGLAGTVWAGVVSAMLWFGAAVADRPDVWGDAAAPSLVFAPATVLFAVMLVAGRMPGPSRLGRGLRRAAASLAGAALGAAFATLLTVAAVSAADARLWAAAGAGMAASGCVSAFGALVAARAV